MSCCGNWKRFKLTTRDFICACKVFEYVIENVENGMIDKRNYDDEYNNEVIDDICCNLFIDRSDFNFLHTHVFIKETLALAFPTLYRFTLS